MAVENSDKSWIAKRVARYREQAARALREAGRATDPDAKRSFLALAEGWQRLANHVEEVAGEQVDEFDHETEGGSENPAPDSPRE